MYEITKSPIALQIAPRFGGAMLLEMGDSPSAAALSTALFRLTYSSVPVVLLKI
jgi:hypothetical protein